MKNLSRSLVLTLSLGLFVNYASAQIGSKSDTTVRNPDEQQRINEQNHRRALEKRDRIGGKQPVTIVLPTSRRPTKEQIENAKEIFERNAEVEKMLLAPTEYYQKYAEFLKNKKTSLARLFIDKNCDQGKTVTVKELERCAGVIPVKGGGSFYSFIFRSNILRGGFWWDIHFAGDKFVVGNDRIQSIIVSLGDVDLKAAEKSKALKFLNKYGMKDTFVEIKEQNEILEKGIENNGFFYSNTAPVKLNQTYLLRTVAYLHDDLPKYYLRETRADLTIAFKVVGRERNGSLILLWKELRSELPRRELK